MKKLLALTLVGISTVGIASACSKSNTNVLEQNHEDGKYRGNFIDGGVNQIGIEFTLEKNAITAISIRSLMRNGCDYTKATAALGSMTGMTCTDTEEVFLGKKTLYTTAINNLKDKSVDYVAKYDKGAITTVVAGATENARFNKIRYAVIDGLLHGKYE